MSPAAIEACPVVFSVDENGTQRITLLDADDSVLCGPTSHRSHPLAAVHEHRAGQRGSPAAPMPAQHFLTPRRADACHWLKLLGHLYAHPARELETPDFSRRLSHPSALNGGELQIEGVKSHQDITQLEAQWRPGVPSRGRDGS